MHLPPESRYKTEAREAAEDDPQVVIEDDGTYGPWSQSEMLLARIVDEIGNLAFMWSDGKGQRPKPYPRPGVDRVTPINPRAAAFLDYIRTHQGAAPPPDWEPEVI